MSDELNSFFDLLISLESINLSKGSILFRGSHEGRRNEFEYSPYLKGIKYFDKCKFNASRYRKKDNPNSILPRENARGLLYEIKVKETIKVIIFPNAGDVYSKFNQAIFAEWPYLKKNYNPQWFREFEQNHLFPLIRQLKRDPDIVGFTTDQIGKSQEYLLDMDHVLFEITNITYFDE